MFITITKRAIIISLAAVIALIAVGVSYYSIERRVAAKGQYTVVIDVGHGGADGGVVGSFYGTKESDVNLYVATALRHYLIKNGINVVMTRNRDVMLSDGKTQSAKLSDMRKRAEIINAAAPQLMISIHQNAYPLASVKGAQVFYDEEGQNGKIAAQTFQQTLNDSLGGNRKEKKAEYYVLQCSKYPSVLVECGFLSNREEEEKLRSPRYREKVAYALYTATVIYLEKNGKEIENIA